MIDEIPWKKWIDESQSRRLNQEKDNLANTLNQSYETLHTFEDFEEFKNSDLLKPWTEFEPNIIEFTVTDTLIDEYAKMFNDSFTPHVILDKEHQSFPSKLLWQSTDNQTKFLQGIGTLSFLNGFVRRLFKFKDKTELLTPRMNNVKWPRPAPEWSKITSEFVIKKKENVDLKIWDKAFEGVKITFDTKLFSDKIPVGPDGMPIPVCVAEWDMLYISPNEKE